MLSIERELEVSAQIYDVTGRLVKTLHEEQMVQPGSHSLSWDGTTSLGGRAASGVYLLKLRAGEAQFVERVVLIR
jgi:flagellar hook assembly protein FlgD